MIAEQQRRFAGVVSAERPWEYLTSVYITGTVDEIQRQIQTRVDMGIEYMMLHTLTRTWSSSTCSRSTSWSRSGRSRES